MAQRLIEFGIRMALGATSRSILTLVMRNVATLLIGGIATGIGLSLATSRLLGALLFGIEARDLTHGIGLSSEVESALPALVEQVLRQVWKIESASKPPQRNNECGPFAAH